MRSLNKIYAMIMDGLGGEAKIRIVLIMDLLLNV